MDKPPGTADVRVEYSLSGHPKERHLWALYAGKNLREAVYTLLRSLQDDGFGKASVWCDNEKFVPTKEEINEYNTFLEQVQRNTEKRRAEPEPEPEPAVPEQPHEAAYDAEYLDSLLMDPKAFEFD